MLAVKQISMIQIENYIHLSKVIPVIKDLDFIFLAEVRINEINYIQLFKQPWTNVRKKCTDKCIIKLSRRNWFLCLKRMSNIYEIKREKIKLIIKNECIFKTINIIMRGVMKLSEFKKMRK